MTRLEELTRDGEGLLQGARITAQEAEVVSKAQHKVTWQQGKPTYSA